MVKTAKHFETVRITKNTLKHLILNWPPLWN